MSKEQNGILNVVATVADFVLSPLRGGTESRATVVLACFALVWLRAAKPELRFDGVSLWLFGIGVFVLLFPDLGSLVKRLTSFKVGNAEARFSKSVEQLARDTERVEEESGSSSEESDPFEGLTEETRKILVSSSGNPRFALISLAVEIEDEIRNLAKIHGLDAANRYASPSRLMNELVSTKAVPDSVAHIFRDFWAIRNAAVHHSSFSLDQERLVPLVDLGLRILKLLRFEGDSSSSGSSSGH